MSIRSGLQNIDITWLVLYSVLINWSTSKTPHLLSKMPRDWAKSSVAIHVNDPFSEAALGEAEKTWIDLGPVDIDACDTEESGRIKVEGEAALATTIPESSSAMISAHHLFLNASRLILGERRLKN